MTNLNEVAKQMVAEGKGILAADESSGTIKKRFDTINVNSSEENRMNYRSSRCNVQRLRNGLYFTFSNLPGDLKLFLFLVVTYLDGGISFSRASVHSKMIVSRAIIF